MYNDKIKEISGQGEIMDRMEALLDYKIEDRGGFCHGFAAMAIQALLVDDFKSFEDRLTELYKQPVESLKGKSHLNQLEVDFRAFFEGMMLYQSPGQIPELFEADDIALRQQDSRQIERIVRSKALDKHGGMGVVGSFSGIYGLEDLSLYFKSLREESKDPIALSLSNNGHTIAVSYDPLNKANPFRVIDANQFPIKTYSKDEEVAEAVLKAFFSDKNQITAFVSTVYATNNRSNEQRQTLDKWMANTSWQKIHNPSEEKVNWVDKQEGSWLSISARGDQAETIDKLLKETKVDPDRADSGERTPLYIAAARGNLKAVTALLKDPRVNPNRQNKYGENPLLAAAKAKQPAIVNALLADERTDPNQIVNQLEGRTILHEAASKGYYELVMDLLADRRMNPAQVDKYGRGVLYFALESNNFTLFEALLASPFSNPNELDKYNETPLDHALNMGRMDMAKLLLARPDLDGSKMNLGSTPLVKASSMGETEIVERLLTRKDVDLNQASINGYTALRMAASQGHIDVVKVLLARPDLSIDKSCFPALEEARNKGYLEIENLIKETIQERQNDYILEPLAHLYRSVISLLESRGTQLLLKESFEWGLAEMEDDIKRASTLDYPHYLDHLNKLICAVKSGQDTNKFYSGQPNADLFKKWEETEIDVFERFCEINNLMSGRAAPPSFSK